MTTKKIKVLKLKEDEYYQKLLAKIDSIIVSARAHQERMTEFFTNLTPREYKVYLNRHKIIKKL